MSPVIWNDKLSVGIEQVDTEHKKLVEIFNQLEEAATAGRGTRVMSETLDRLIAYTTEHFIAEEALMSKAEYPQLQLHSAQHRQLVQKVLAFQTKFNASGRRITKDMIAFLNYWLTNHIQHDDMVFGAYWQAKQGQAQDPATVGA